MPKKLKIIRSWLILQVEGTNQIILLKRSKSSNNARQWDFIGGSGKLGKVSPRKLIRKESSEEIGFTPSRLSKKLVVVAKFSIYHYFIGTIKKKQLRRLELSHEHSKFKVVPIHKLPRKKRLHHSVEIFLNNS